MGRLDLRDPWRDEDELPVRHWRTVAWWRREFVEGRSAASVNAVLREHGVLAPSQDETDVPYPYRATRRAKTRAETSPYSYRRQGPCRPRSDN